MATPLLKLITLVVVLGPTVSACLFGFAAVRLDENPTPGNRLWAVAAALLLFLSVFALGQIPT